MLCGSAPLRPAPCLRINPPCGQGQLRCAPREVLRVRVFTFMNQLLHRYVETPAGATTAARVAKIHNKDNIVEVRGGTLRSGTQSVLAPPRKVTSPDHPKLTPPRRVTTQGKLISSPRRITPSKRRLARSPRKVTSPDHISGSAKAGSPRPCTSSPERNRPESCVN